MSRGMTFSWHVAACCAVLLFLSGCNRDHSLSFQGYIEGENIYLASPYAGLVVKKLVMRGQRVLQGDLLFVLAPDPEKLSVEQQRALVEEAKSTWLDLQKPKRPLEIDAITDKIAQADANLALSTLRVKRYEQLYQQHAVELDRLDEARNMERVYAATKAEYQANAALAHLGARVDEINAQHAKVVSAQAQLSIAEWKLARKSLRAPADGVIFDTYFQVGEYVPAARPVATLLPNTQIRVEFFVPLQALAALHLNQTIHFVCDGSRRSNRARISYISSEAEYVPPLVYSRENRDNLIFRIKAQVLDNPTQFKPGQPVRVLVEPDRVE